MTRALILGDLHLSEKSVGVVVDALDIAMELAVDRMDDPVIVQVGDVNDNKRSVSTRAMSLFQDAVAKWSEYGVRSHWIPGNHDQPGRALSSTNALRMLRGLDGVSVYHKPTWTDLGLMLPHCYDADDFAKAVSHVEAGRPPVLFCHQGVRGAYMNNTRKDSDGVDSASLSAFGLVVAGHYHRPQQLGDLWYVGTPWQTGAGEAGQQKRVLIVDGAEVVESIPVDIGRRFHVIEWDGEGDVPTLPDGVVDGDDVRLKITGPTRLLKSEGLRTALIRGGYADATVIAVAKDEARSRISMDGLTLAQVVERYISDTCDPTVVDVDAVLREFREVAT